MEVIDLTGVSPPPKGNADTEEPRLTRGERRKERRRVREEEERRHEEERRREARERGRERDPRLRSKGDDHPDRDSKRPRDSSRERETDRKRRKKDRERERERDEEPPIPDNQLFFVDDGPAALPPAARYVAATAKEEPNGLILPAHVSVFGETPVTILPATAQDSDEDEDYIEYLDYDNRKDFVRYYEEEKRHTTTRIVCKRCGAEGEHTTAECTVLIVSRVIVFV